MFGGGHYGTVKAHSDRWQKFVKWCRSEAGPGINDARQIDREMLDEYAAYLRDLVEHGDIVVSTAQNRISSVNRTMAALRGDQAVSLPSPSKALDMQRTEFGSRCPKAKTALTFSESSTRCVRVISSDQQRSFSWREPPACACVRQFWLTCHGYAERLETLARSIFKMAPKAAEPALRHHAGLRWISMFATRSNLRSGPRQQVAAT